MTCIQQDLGPSALRLPVLLATVHSSTSQSLSAPPSDKSVEPSGPYPELVGCLITSGMRLVLGGRARVVLTGHPDASSVDDLATQRSSRGYTFSLGSSSVSWRSTRSSSVLSSSCEAEIYAGAMAAQELRWLTYLLTDLGEAPCSPPQRGQLHLGYVASQANNADVFTKALQPCDHQHFCTFLGLLVLRTLPSATLTPPLLCPPPDKSQPPLLPASPLLAPSPYTEQCGGLTQRREPASCPVLLVRTARRVPRSRPPLVSGMHAMNLRPSSLPLRVPLPAPPESSLPEVPDPESNHVRAASPIVSRLLATAVTDPSFESAAASALLAELLDCSAPCRLDYATALVADSASASPPSIECLAAAVPRFASMLLAPEGDPDAITGPYSSQWQAAMDAEMASWKSTGPFVDEVPPPGVNIVDGMWIFRHSFPAGQPARGDLAARPPGFTGTFPAGTQWSLRRPVYGLRQAPREWHDTLRTTLAALGFSPSTADPSPFLRTDNLVLPLYVLVYVDDLVFATADTEALTLVKSELQKRHTCTDLAPPSDESVEPSGPYPKLVGCLITSGMGLVLGRRGPVVVTGHVDASLVDDSATQRSSRSYTFSLGSGSVSWQSTRSSLVLSSSCEAEIYVGAMAAQELRWLIYLLNDLGERPRSPPVLFVDNKAMIALCREHRLEHRPKHIALRYFLARELQ
ncbi:unnamed protein product [Closterium sp. NIES-53]